MPTVDRNRIGAGRAGDEALVGGRAVQVGPSDRPGPLVGPVDVLAVDRNPTGMLAPEMKFSLTPVPSTFDRPIVPAVLELVQ